jgi:hypothetical protein
MTASGWGHARTDAKPSELLLHCFRVVDQELETSPVGYDSEPESRPQDFMDPRLWASPICLPPRFRIIPNSSVFRAGGKPGIRLTFLILPNDSVVVVNRLKILWAERPVRVRSPPRANPGTRVPHGVALVARLSKHETRNPRPGGIVPKVCPRESNSSSLEPK